MANSKRIWILVLTFIFLVFLPLITIPIDAQSDWNEGTITIDPDEGDRLTPSGNPVRSGEPGDELYFTLWVTNDHSQEQRVLLSVADGPDWTIAVTGSVDIPPGDTVSIDLYVEIPDAVFDPSVLYPIRIEGNANLTMDKAFIIVVIEPEVEIDHEMVIVPNNVRKLEINVYPGQRTFIDVKVLNTGNMDDTYLLRILEHLTTWDIQFREGGKEIELDLGHLETENTMTTSILIKVPSNAVVGQSIDLRISSLSDSSEMFEYGTRSELIEMDLVVTSGASINIRPSEKGTLLSEDYIETSFILSHSGVTDAALTPMIIVTSGGIVQNNWEIMTAPPGPYALSIGDEIEVSVRSVPKERTYGYFDLVFDGSSSLATVTPGYVTAYFEPLSELVLGELTGAPFDRGEEVVIQTSLENRGDVSQQAVIEVDGVTEEYITSILPSQDLFLKPGEVKNIVVKLHPRSKGSDDPFDVNISVKMPMDDQGGQWGMADKGSIKVDFRDLPDLELKEIDIPISTIDEGSLVCINVTVSNNGNIPVKNATLEINQITFALSNPSIDVMLVDLQPGEVKVLCIEWNARPAAKSIRARISTPDGQEEMELEDNEKVEPIYVIPTRIEREIGGNEEMEIPVVPAAAGGAGLILLTGLLVFLSSKDAVRYPFFLAMGPLYSKLRPEHILNNRLRKRIYVYVQNHPGEHFRSILTHLDLTNGTLAHHLYTLEKENLIRSKRDGLYRRFYPAGYQIDETRISLSAIQTRIMELVLEEPGLSQKDISIRLKLSNSTVNYNIKSLADKGLVQIMKEGKSTSILPVKDGNS